MKINVSPICIKCGKHITNDEIGLCKKMINRSVTEYLCIECLSERFGITVERARVMTEQFRKSGCTLFSKE